jgi:hypothetical protein
VSKRWKDLERGVATLFRGKRIVRADFGETEPDVAVPDFPELRVDCKAYARFSHHSLLSEVRRKYCGDGQVPVLVTKAARQIGANVTVPIEHYADLLDAARKLRAAEKGEGL